MISERLAGLSLRRRLAAASAVVVLLVVVAAVVLGVAASRLQHAIHEKADVVTPSQVDAAKLITALVDQETAIRAYALKRQTLYLAPYNSGRVQERALTADLHRLLAGQPSIEPDFRTLQARVGDWHRLYADPTLAAYRAGDTQGALRVSSDLGKARFDTIRRAESDLEGALARRSTAARHDVTDDLTALVGLLIGVGVAALVLLALLFMGLRSWVTGPLRRLGSDARTVAGGALEHQVAPVGPPDVAIVASSVDSMRLQLLRELNAAQAAGEALEVQADNLRRSNRDLEQFAYVASHDLQEPLRKVASFCQLLERRYGDQLDERGAQYIAFAVDGAKRMQQLINDLLAFSRVGRTTERFVPVPLGDALARARNALSHALEAAGAQVSADPLPTVPGDPTLLAQLFQNLLGNAVKFRGDDPPRIHIGATARPAVDGDGPGEWELSCADNGIGIEPAYAEKIFVIFQRLHGRDAYEGTGIGLALCRKIVEYHGGRLWLDVEPRPAGTGTTFRWTLPAEPTTEPTTEPTNAPANEPTAEPARPAQDQETAAAPEPVAADSSSTGGST